MSDELVTAALTTGAAIVGAGIKGGWDYLRGRDRDDATVKRAEIVDAAAIRAELWQEIENLRDRMDRMQIELDRSRQGYLELLAEHTTLRAEHRTLEHDHEQLKRRYAGLEAEVITLRARDAQILD